MMHSVDRGDGCPRDELANMSERKSARRHCWKCELALLRQSESQLDFIADNAGDGGDAGDALRRSRRRVSARRIS